MVDDAVAVLVDGVRGRVERAGVGVRIPVVAIALGEREAIAVVVNIVRKLQPPVGGAARVGVDREPLHFHRPIPSRSAAGRRAGAGGGPGPSSVGRGIHFESVSFRRRRARDERQKRQKTDAPLKNIHPRIPPAGKVSAPRGRAALRYPRVGTPRRPNGSRRFHERVAPAFTWRTPRRWGSSC